jgi:predicted porin
MGADYQATEKLSIDASITYNQAEASMESISLTEPFTPTGVLEAFYSDFEDRIGLVENYSDLEYTQIDVSIGGSYDFTDRLYATASATYSDFDSDEEYVYGDESGSAYYGNVGIGYRF